MGVYAIPRILTRPHTGDTVQPGPTPLIFERIAWRNSVTRPIQPLIDAEKVGDAFNAFVLPGIFTAFQGKHVNKEALHVVALRPGVPFHPDADLPVMFERSFNKGTWKNPYDLFARGKARITWRTRRSSRDIVLNAPHLLMPGDPTFWGSVILDDIIVGVSGVESYFDEMFAMMTAAAIKAEASHYFKKLEDLGDEAPDFLS